MWDTWKSPRGGRRRRGRVPGRASLDAALHHAVLAASPAGACLVTLKDQGGLDLVKLLEQPPVLGCGGRGQWFLCGAHFSCPGPRGLHRKLHSDPSPEQERKVQTVCRLRSETRKCAGGHQSPFAYDRAERPIEFLAG